MLSYIAKLYLRKNLCDKEELRKLPHSLSSHLAMPSLYPSGVDLLVCHPILLYITYPHFGLINILVSRYMMVNYHLL
jgi:hypothetical protein